AIPSKPLTVAVQATALGVELSSSTRAAWLTPDGSASFSIRLANRMGNAKGAFTTGSVGSAFRQSRSIAQGEQHVFQIDVPKGAGSLSATIQTDGSEADLDVYLFDCSTLGAVAGAPYDRSKGGKSPALPPASCVPKGKSAAFGKTSTVAIDNPAAGRWTVVVDGYRVPAGSV